MNAETFILNRLDAACRALDLDDLSDIRWSDGRLIRNCAARSRRGDRTAWREFVAHVGERPRMKFAITEIWRQFGWLEHSAKYDRLQLTLPHDFPPVDAELRTELTAIIHPSCDVADQKPRGKKLGSIMYIEEKPGLAGHARIGRVTRSATGRTIYYAGRTLRSLNGRGYKTNYFNVESGLSYWISNCKQDGNDTLYPGVVEIDEDAREEYWTVIRKLPDKIGLTKFRSLGKHGR